LKRCLCAAALLSLSLTGCGALHGGTAEGATGGPAAASAPTTTSGFGSVKDSGDIPDPCTLLTDDEVVDSTGREITRMDQDGGHNGDTTRYCQWQQDGGQLAVFLTRTTAEEFDLTSDDAEPVDGVGEDAVALAGHLYVRYGTVQIDVYSRGRTDDENLRDATAVAKALIPRV
jgi:hypothetical protein